MVWVIFKGKVKRYKNEFNNEYEFYVCVLEFNFVELVYRKEVGCNDDDEKN